MGKANFVLSLLLLFFLLAALFAVRHFFFVLEFYFIADLLAFTGLIAVVLGLPLIWLSYFEKNVKSK